MLKSIYKKVIMVVMNLPGEIDLLKTYLFEYLSIIKKRNLYKNVVWSNEQQKEFDNYWKSNYGKKISNRWHKLYQSVNEELNVRYFPEFIYSTKVEPKMNNYLFSNLLQDKAFIEPLYYKKVHIPKTYGLNSSNIFYDSNRNIITKKKFTQIIDNIGPAVIKPTIESSSGDSVRILHTKNGKDILTNESVINIMNYYKKNYIIQEKIKPHEAFEKIYNQSINTIRLLTYIVNGKINHAPISFRMGTGGSEVDNIHAGGLSISISDYGELGKYAYQLGYGEGRRAFEKHPDSKIKFENYYIPYVPEIIRLGYELHGLTPHIGIASWDFTIDDKENINLIEVNLAGQSA